MEISSDPTVELGEEAEWPVLAYLEREKFRSFDIFVTGTSTPRLFVLLVSNVPNVSLPIWQNVMNEDLGALKLAFETSPYHTKEHTKQTKDSNRYFVENNRKRRTKSNFILQTYQCLEPSIP